MRAITEPNKRKSISSGDIFPKIIWEAQDGQNLRSWGSEIGSGADIWRFGPVSRKEAKSIENSVFRGGVQKPAKSHMKTWENRGAPIDH